MCELQLWLCVSFGNDPTVVEPQILYLFDRINLSWAVTQKKVTQILQRVGRAQNNDHAKRAPAVFVNTRDARKVIPHFITDWSWSTRPHIIPDVRTSPARVRMVAGPCSSSIGSALRDLARDIVDDEVMDYEASVIDAKVLIRPLMITSHPLIPSSIYS